MIETHAEYLRRQAATMLAEAARLDALPQDEFEPGAVVTWSRTFGTRTYTYAAVKYKDGLGATWATTTTRQNRVDWATLCSYYLDHADAGSVYWASELEPVEGFH